MYIFLYNYKKDATINKKLDKISLANGVELNEGENEYGRM